MTHGSGNNASGEWKPGRSERAGKSSSAMDEFWFDDRTARRFAQRLNRNDMSRVKREQKGFG